MKKIFTKIFVYYLMLIVVLFTIILYISFNYIKSTNEINKRAELTSVAQAFVVYAEDNNISESKNLKNIVEAYKKKINTRITIIDTNGTVIIDTDKEPSTMENHASRIEFVDAMKFGIGSDIRFSQTVKKRHVVRRDTYYY